MRIDHCAKCKAAIVWLKTKTGKAMPVNAETAGDDDKEYEHGKHISHFATCEFAAQFRRKR
jgi:hypothetical protein